MLVRNGRFGEGGSSSQHCHKSSESWLQPKTIVPWIAVRSDTLSLVVIGPVILPGVTPV